MCPYGSQICPQNLKISLIPYFRPLRARIGPNFGFHELFFIGDKKRVWYIISCIKFVYFENENFFSLFRVLRDFTNLGNTPKWMMGQKNNDIFGFSMKSYTFKFVIVSFLRPKLRFTRKIKNLEKNRKIWMIFSFWSTISPIPFARFCQFFFANHRHFYFIFR